jgi:hypothetical protein
MSEQLDVTSEAAPEVIADGADEGVAVESDNLFAEVEQVDEPEVPAETQEAEGESPPGENAEEKALFETLRTKYESENFKTVKAARDAATQEAESLRTQYQAFEPLRAIPEAAEKLTKLATGQVDGREGWEIVQTLATPNVAEAIKEEAFWTYAENPANADIMTKSLLGNHVDADLLKQVAAAIDPVSGYMTVEDLRALIEQTPDSILTSEEKQQRDDWRKEQSAIKAERESLAMQRQQQEAQIEQQAQMTAATEIFNFTDKPIDDVEKLYGFTPNEKDSPAVKEIKTDASKTYRALIYQSMVASEQAQNNVRNIQALLKQGSQLKDRANSMYAPDLQRITKANAVEAAKFVNRYIVKPQIEQLRREAGKPQSAPKELGSMAGGGAGLGQQKDEPVDERRQLGHRVYQDVIAGAQA